jgi:iron complex outermembrane receptor protein
VQADGASIGGSYIFQGGFIGAAITQNDTLYRIPGIDGPITRPGSTRAKPNSAKGEYRPDARQSTPSGSGPAPPITSTTRSARRSADLVLGVRQTFTNKDRKARRGADDAVQRAFAAVDSSACRPGIRN